MSVQKSALILTTALSSLFFSGAAIAESTVADEIIVQGRVLYSDQVNAVKTPTPIIDVPQSLTIIGADEIRARGFLSIGDLIDYTPGVNMSQGEGHRDAIVFRGVRSTADFFLDGVRDDVQYYRPLYNLEQVEILRGPNALLFGRGGTGGVLNRVTKKGVLGEEFNNLEAGIDTFGAYDIAIDSNFATSDNSALRLNVYYSELDNHRDFYDGERIGINPTYRVEINSTTMLDLSYEYADHDRFVDRGIPTGADGRPVEALQDIVFGDPEDNFNELEAHLLRATLQHEFSDRLKGNFSAFYGDYDKVYQNFFTTDYDEATNIVELDGYIDATDRQNLILSGNLIGEYTTGALNHTLLAGMEFIDTSSDQDRFNSFFDTSTDDRETFIATRPLALNGSRGVNADGDPTVNDFTVSLNDDTRVSIDVFSAYIQDEIEISEKLDIVIGARFDSFDIEVDNRDPANLEIRTRTDEEVSPRFGVIYKPQENISLYGSYSESFLPRSGEQFANINGTNDQLDPDVFENAEIGLKWDFTPELSFTAAYFQNEQTRAARDNATGENFEVRGLEVDGFELQLQGYVTEDVYISAGYSYLDGETATGLTPRELPENMFSFWSAFQVTEQFGFGIGATYQDESLITDGSQERLPSYTRFDAAAYYDVSEDLRVRINVENLTDELYFPNAHSTHQATVGAPLNARLSVSKKF
ncbi:MAG: TonB-dependent siderophore receptor [Aquisalinus sp.]|nr:TonB-dependent siderophore receptor [Aquisalinus sp.]